jgi:hypothetical protein
MKSPFGTDMSDPFGNAPFFELELEKWAAPLGKTAAKVPPSYRDSVADSESCSQCANHNLISGRAWKGEGYCSEFKVAAHGQKTCDSHTPQ